MKLPRRGNVLSRLVSAFRLERAESGTAKRIYGDHPEVSEEMFAEEIGRLVGRVFDPEYLKNRGLSESEIAEHQRLLSGAVGQVLHRWDYLASAVRNTSPLMALPPLPFLAIMLGVVPDVLARAAAYDHLYGRMHPVRNDLPMLLRKDGLTEWWAIFERGLGRQFTLNQLARETRCTKRTVKNARNGDIPTGGVLKVLATGLARVVAVDSCSAAEIEFSLRATAAAQAALSWSRGIEQGHPESWVRQFRLLRAAVADLGRSELIDLLERGIGSPSYGPLQEALTHDAQQQVIAAGHEVAARAASLERLTRLDPDLGMRLFVAENRARAAELQSMGNGDNDSASLLAEYFAGTADLFEAVWEKKTPPSPRPGYLEELQAMMLVMNAIAPGLRKPAAEAELLLRRAVEICPTSVLARETLAQHFVETGRRAEAIQHYRETARLRADDPAAWYTLAANLGELDRWAEALESVEEAPTQDLELRAIRGYCLVKLGQLDEGRAILDAVLSESKDHVIALDGLSLIESTRGNKREASTLLRKAWFHAGPRLRVGNGK